MRVRLRRQAEVARQVDHAGAALKELGRSTGALAVRKREERDVERRSVVQRAELDAPQRPCGQMRMHFAERATGRLASTQEHEIRAGVIEEQTNELAAGRSRRAENADRYPRRRFHTAYLCRTCMNVNYSSRGSLGSLRPIEPNVGQ